MVLGRREGGGVMGKGYQVLVHRDYSGRGWRVYALSDGSNYIHPLTGYMTHDEAAATADEIRRLN